MSTAKAIKVSKAAKNEVSEATSVTVICWENDMSNAMNVTTHAIRIKVY